MNTLISLSIFVGLLTGGSLLMAQANQPIKDVINNQIDAIFKAGDNRPQRNDQPCATPIDSHRQDTKSPDQPCSGSHSSTPQDPEAEAEKYRNQDTEMAIDQGTGLAKDQVKGAIASVLPAAAKPFVENGATNLDEAAEIALKKSTQYAAANTATAVGKAAGSEFLKDTLPEVLGSDAFGAGLGILFHPEQLGGPSDTQVYGSGHVSFEDLRKAYTDQTLSQFGIWNQINHDRLNALRTMQTIQPRAEWRPATGINMRGVIPAQPVVRPVDPPCPVGVSCAVK